MLFYLQCYYKLYKKKKNNNLLVYILTELNSKMFGKPFLFIL